MESVWETKILCKFAKPNVSVEQIPAMFLKRLIIKDFKNISEADLIFSDGLNCICGDNGEGKTNLLDAIWHLSMTKSFLLLTDRYTCRKGTGQTVLNGTYADGAEEHKVAFSLSSGGEKSLRKDGKNYNRLSDHIGEIPVVVISPSDTSLVTESGEERRRFLNIMLSQADRSYLQAVQNYNRCLSQRNKVLRQMSENQKNGLGNGGIDMLLEAISIQLDITASTIYQARKSACRQLSEKVSEYYRMISTDREEVSMTYVSDLEKGEMSELLNASLERDKILLYTSVGIQRDDIRLLMNGLPMKQCASQGQQKSFVTALKMSQYSIMRERYGMPPILLLDDIFDRLDSKRVECLLKMVSGPDFGQIFITDTDRERLSVLASDAPLFSVKNGAISNVSSSENDL